VINRRIRIAGYSLLEVLVSLAILLAGVLAIMYFFPRALESRHEAALLTKGALLAQGKAQEIRRDDDTTGTLVAAIEARTEPTIPIVFPDEPELSYAFSGKSVLYQESDSPRGDPNVARVLIIRSSRPTAGVRAQDVLYELRFGS
jgi:type II secretory pathway pseudopilin PulG